LPWVNYFFKNELNDYNKAIYLWQAVLSKRENLEAIRKMLKKAGFGAISSRKTMKIILNNSDSLIDAAKRDTNAADDVFKRQSRLVGMTVSEANLFGRKNKNIADRMNDTSVANLIDYWVQIGKANFSWKVLHFLLNQRSLSVMHNRMRYKYHERTKHRQEAEGRKGMREVENLRKRTAGPGNGQIREINEMNTHL